MKILHLLASPVFSGPAEQVALLARAQRNLGHDVSVAIDRKRTAVTSEELAAPLFREMKLLDETGLELSVKSTPWRVLRDAKTLRQSDAQVVHCHFSHDHVVARLGLPAKARLVRSIHAARSLSRFTPRCDAMTVPFENLLSHAPRVPAMVLPALVDDVFSASQDRESLKTLLGLPTGPLVGMVSALQGSRRHDVAIEAFAKVRQRMPQAHLVVMGDGVEAEAIRQKIDLHQLQEAVTCVGYRPSSEFPQWLKAFDEVWILGLGNDFSARAAAQARKSGARVVGVSEGALPALADVVVQPNASEVAEVALQSQRSPKPIADLTEVAQRVLDLYAQVTR